MLQFDYRSPVRRVLVIGGTGFLGHAITAAFVQNGDHVVVLTRGQRRSSGDAELIRANRSDPSSLDSALRNREFDVVVDNIAYDGPDARAVLEGLRGRVGHYLQTSSAAVYANRYVRRPLRESQADLSLRIAPDAPNPFHSRLGHAYANGKRSAEQVAADSDSDVPWTVLRPPVILAADDRTNRVWWFVQRLLDGGPLLIPDWGPGRMFQLGWTHDIARAFCAAAGQPAAFGHAYNVAQAEVYTAETWIEAVADVLGTRARYAHVPEGQLDDVGLAGYTLPVAGRPFGHVLLDTRALACDLGFEPSPEAVWLKETIGGCAAYPPATDSSGYDRRQAEINVALALPLLGA